MKTGYLLLFFALTTSAHAVENANAIHFDDFACKKEVQEFLVHWEVAKNATWSKQASTGKVVSWKAHGKNLGEWITLQATPKSVTTLVHLLPDQKVEQVTFNQTDCSVKKVSGRLPAQVEPNVGKKADFTDEDLQKILTANKNGLIYIWSPHMTLSVKGIADIKKAAAAVGMPVDLVMDPIADETRAQEILKELDLPATAILRMHSNELGGHSVTLHYPALMVYKAGVLCSTVQRGWRDSDDYRKIVTEIFGECK